MNQRPEIDPDGFARLAELAGGDEVFLDELVDTYALDGEDQVARLRAACADADMPAIVIAAHSLKTNSANVGATGVAELASAFEADARAGSVDPGSARVEAIAAAFEAARAALLAMRGRG